MSGIQSNYANMQSVLMQSGVSNISAKDAGDTNVFGEIQTNNANNDEFDTYNNIKNSYIDSIISSFGSIADAYPCMTKSSMTELLGAMDTIINKGCEIRDTYMQTEADYCFNDIQAIMADSSKTPEEKKEAIDLIVKKMEATKDEAAKKMGVLTKLMRACSRIASLTLYADSSKINLSEAMGGILDIVSGIDSSVPNYSKADTPDKLDKIKEENMQNIFGNKTSKYKKQSSQIDDKIQKQKDILNDNSSDDAAKTNAKIMLASLEAQKEIFKSIPE